MARNAAAMPQPVAMNCRRLRPSRLLCSSANSKIRRSTRFCVSLCLGGRYSPLETIWVGIGVAAEAVSAPATIRCSRSLSQLPIAILPWLLLVINTSVDRESLDLSFGLDNVSAAVPQRLVGIGLRSSGLFSLVDVPTDRAAEHGAEARPFV